MMTEIIKVDGNFPPLVDVGTAQQRNIVSSDLQVGAVETPSRPGRPLLEKCLNRSYR
jgi:hypothetical protein